MFRHKAFEKKHLIFVGSKVKILTFQKYFTEPETLYNGHFFPVITHWTWKSPLALQGLYQTK